MPGDKNQILTTLASAEETEAAIQTLKEAGLNDISLFSPLDPVEAKISVSKKKSGVGWFTWSGAFLGALFGGVFSVGTAVVYPVETGGLPILSLPAIGIMAFDFMLLGAIIGTIFGFLYCALWVARSKGCVPRAVTGHAFGLRILGDETMLKQAEDVLKKTGAKKVSRSATAFGAGLSFIFLIPALVLGFSGTRNMMNQPVTKSQERAIRVPSSLVPHSIHSGGEPASKDEAAILENPTPLSEASFTRGKQLYEIFCTLCHGETGKGDGVMAERIGEFPDFSKPGFLDQPDGCFYFVITHGANFEEEVFRPRETAGGDEHADEGGEIVWDDAPSGEIVWDEPAHDDTDDHHAHDDGGSGEDHAHDEEHAHADAAMSPVAMNADDGHEHDHGDDHAHGEEMGHDDGHAHDHGGGDGHDDHAHDAPGCSKGHEHGSGGHGHGGDDGHGHAHGSGKKHFMPPHRDAILPIDRWHIVNYIRYELGQ